MENPTSAPPLAPPAMPPAPPEMPPAPPVMLPDPPPVAASRFASKRIRSPPAPVPVLMPATRTSPPPSPAGCPPPQRSGLVERSSSAVKAVVDIATARREAIREGEKRKQAQGRGEAEEGAGKGLMDKSSNAATATAQREAIRKRKRKQEQDNEGEGISSSVKHKVPRSRAAPAKRFKSPLASKSTGVRMMLSPRVITPSTTLDGSSQESSISPFIKKKKYAWSRIGRCTQALIQHLREWHVIF